MLIHVLLPEQKRTDRLQQVVCYIRYQMICLSPDLYAELLPLCKRASYDAFQDLGVLYEYWTLARYQQWLGWQSSRTSRDPSGDFSLLNHEPNTLYHGYTYSRFQQQLQVMQMLISFKASCFSRRA